MATGATATNELIYPYIKLREEFGRQPRFLEDHWRLHCNILPNKAQKLKHRRMRLVDRSIQAVIQRAQDEINTDRVIHDEKGIRHEEGGWPKDVSVDEPEMIIRHRKKLEKEEQYTISLPIMTNLMEKFVKQNNALELFEEHCPRKWRHKDKQRQTSSAQTIQIFRDFSFMQRAVHKIDWAPDNVGRMVVSHVPRRFDRTLRESPTDAYIWDVEVPSRPESMLRSGSHIMDVRYHTKDLHSMIGACFNGTVQFWDNRVSPNPQMTSPLDGSHEDICSSALWVNSKTNTEFFSAGMDGQVIWWDVRKMDEKLDHLWADPDKGEMRPEYALPCTVLEYESTLPTKFLVGVETGNVMIFMKKGKSPSDRMSNNYKAHRGPIMALQRNPVLIKNFLTVGDSTCRIFAEDCRDSSVMWTAPNDAPYTHGAWIPSRPSCFGVTRADGHIDIWDLIRDAARPHCTVKIADAILTCFAPCHSPSKFLAVGTAKGAVYMQRLSDSLYKTEKTDKTILAGIFERESRREKFIEQRYREGRLKKRDKEKQEQLKENLQKQREAFAAAQQAKAKEEGKEFVAPDYSKNAQYDIAYEARNDPRTQAERKFFQDLDTELREKGVDAWEEWKAHENETDEDRRLSGEDFEITDEDLALAAIAAHEAAQAEIEGEHEDHEGEGGHAPAAGGKPKAHDDGILGLQPSTSKAHLQEQHHSLAAHILPSESMAEMQPSSSKAQIQQSSSKAQIQPSSSMAQMQPSSSTAQIQPSSSMAQMQPSSSTAQIQPSSSMAQMQPSSSTAQIQPSSSRAEIQPSSSRAEIQQSSSKAQIQSSSSRAEIQQSSSKAQIQPSSSRAEIQPSSSMAQVQPSSSRAEIQQSSSKAQIQPSSSRAEIQQSSSKAQIQPSSSMAQVQPSSSRAEIQQSSSKSQIQPSSSVAQVQPSSSRAEIQQSSSKAQIQQSSSKTQIQPSSSVAQVQPSSSRAEIQPSSSRAAIQQSSSKAQIQPPSDSEGEDGGT